MIFKSYIEDFKNKVSNFCFEYKTSIKSNIIPT